MPMALTAKSSLKILEVANPCHHMSLVHQQLLGLPLLQKRFEHLQGVLPTQPELC